MPITQKTMPRRDSPPGCAPAGQATRGLLQEVGAWDANIRSSLPAQRRATARTVCLGMDLRSIRFELFGLRKSFRGIPHLGKNIKSLEDELPSRKLTLNYFRTG